MRVFQQLVASVLISSFIKSDFDMLDANRLDSNWWQTYTKPQKSTTCIESACSVCGCVACIDLVGNPGQAKLTRILVEILKKINLENLVTPTSVNFGQTINPLTNLFQEMEVSFAYMLFLTLGNNDVRKCKTVWPRQVWLWPKWTNFIKTSLPVIMCTSPFQRFSRVGHFNYCTHTLI